ELLIIAVTLRYNLLSLHVTSNSILLFLSLSLFSFFFFNDTATTEIYTLSLHDLFRSPGIRPDARKLSAPLSRECCKCCKESRKRSEEHTSELQSRGHLVCRLLLEKKKKKKKKLIELNTKIKLQNVFSVVNMHFKKTEA